MASNLSVKNAPGEIARGLRRAAERNRRSLQSELLAIIEAAAREERAAGPGEVLAEVRRLGLQTPCESADLIRSGRDGR